MADSGKAATLDMAYNLGAERLYKTYPRWNRAASAQHWAECANQSGRNTFDAGFTERNKWTKKMFLQAAGINPTMPTVAIA